MVPVLSKSNFPIGVGNDGIALRCHVDAVGCLQQAGVSGMPSPFFSGNSSF